MQPLDRVRAGILTPASITIRILIPDMTQPSAIPSRADTGEDDPRLRERARRIADRSTGAIVDAAGELTELGLVADTRAEVRVHPGAPQLKVYVLNGEQVFFGFYPVVRRAVSVDGKRVSMFDVLGKDVPMMHFAREDDEASESNQFVHQAQAWFDSVWSSIGREPQR